MLLDFWDARLPDARYVIVYRAPWDVSDSMQRLGAAEFLSHPEFAYRIWHHYNRVLLAFARRHRDRIVALLLRTGGGYQVSLRAPDRDGPAMHLLAQEFESGGGRARSAGIQFLPESDLARLMARLGRPADTRT